MQKTILIIIFLLPQSVCAKTGPGLQIPKSGGNRISLSHLHQNLFYGNYYSHQPIKLNDVALLENDSKKDDDVPHFTAGKLPKQIIAGGAMGAILGIIGGSVGAALVAASHPEDGWAALGGFVIGAYSGFVLGNIGGVYIAGRSQKLNGSLWATAAGGAIGVLSGIGVVAATDKGWGLFVLPIIGATFAFDLTI